MSDIELMQLIEEEVIYVREWRDSLTSDQLKTI